MLISSGRRSQRVFRKSTKAISEWFFKSKVLFFLTLRDVSFQIYLQTRDLYRETRRPRRASNFIGHRSTILIEIIFIISIQKVSLYNTFFSSGFLQRKLKDFLFNLKRNAVCSNSRNYFISIYWNERWFEKAGSYLYILLNSLQGLTLLSTGRVLCCNIFLDLWNFLRKYYER